PATPVSWPPLRKYSSPRQLRETIAPQKIAAISHRARPPRADSAPGPPPHPHDRRAPDFSKNFEASVPPPFHAFADSPPPASHWPTRIALCDAANPPAKYSTAASAPFSPESRTRPASHPRPDAHRAPAAGKSNKPDRH